MLSIIPFLDECQIGTSTCDVTAVCYNSPGSYSCECLSGYSGDGYTCTKILSCADVQCGQNAECVELSAGNPECRCLPKFYGDGLFCYEPTGVEVGTGMSTRLNLPYIKAMYICIYIPYSK